MNEWICETKFWYLIEAQMYLTYLPHWSVLIAKHVGNDIKTFFFNVLFDAW